MKSFSKFYFKKFEFDNSNLQARFYYSFDNEVFFEEIIDFKSDIFSVRKNIDLDILNNILFHLHIALGISYYKAFPTNDLIVESGFLDDYQINFWKKFYINGLGEFLYTNKISPSLLFNFVNNSDKKYCKKDFKVNNKALVAIGGGKDSIVTIELLKKAKLNFDLCVFGKTDELKENTAETSGKINLLIKRKISDNLFELNKEGYYNGHIPITGIIAFVLEVVTYLYDYKYIILSNERSANFGNTLWEGVNINHQYSKSLEFEQDFAGYVEKYISSEVKYFSLLRGMYEIKIAELFSSLGKKYFKIFSSCNNNFKIFSENKLKQSDGKYWCNNCPKCAFVFSILRPYLSNKEILDIFGEDLFERKNLEKIFRELLGISGIKPFECVGEAEEVIYSMYLTLKNHYNFTFPKGVPEGGEIRKNIPYILKIFKKEVLPNINENNLKNTQKKLVRIYNEDIIPSELKELIFKNI